MKLNYLQLCNFRQFYGKTPQIKFASGERNTTVIYGNNGAGKTSILNAFTWVLYEKFTAAFASPELLVNQKSLAEAAPEQAVECWVELQFERDRKIYQLKRKCYASKNVQHQINYTQANLFMLVAGDDGRWYPPLESPEDIINRILPASLHQYFFFDGERIDGFFRQNHNSNIAEDTKELLGVKVLDRGIEHLKKAKRSLQEELAELGDAQTKQLLKEQINLEQDLEAIKQLITKITKEVAELEQRKATLSRQLLEISGVDEIQKLKLKLVKQQKIIKQNLLQSKKELKKLLSQDSYVVFLPSISDRFISLLQTLRDRGQLSSGLKQEFIQQLLEQQRCLCGGILTPNTDTYNNVKSWLEKAELQNIEESAIRLETQVNTIKSQAADFWQQLDRQQAEIKQQYLELNRLETETEQANKQLNSYPNRDAQQLQQNIETIEEKIKGLILEQGENQQQQSDRTQQLEQLSQKIARHQLTETKQKLAQTRIAVTEEAIVRLHEVRSRLEQQFRLALEQKVQEIFSFISFTPYLPKLSSDYKLTLIENTSGIAAPVAASTGENQILSLSFIGGIIDRVRQWSEGNSLVGYDSSTFPIVMDSPFGSLDQIYRRQVATAIPQLANQLIILVTKTQWQGEVEQATKSLIGQEYVLTYYSPKQNCKQDHLELNQQDYLLVKPSLNNFEYTKIVPVKSIDQ
ncbi:ATP-binding protein [Pleurocapsa sp. CCALA 161]|uniref:AAA family ATPase n=1 Tax=Pleurocapsa sp. CCALA 161 TaxID=2107688 RepID=UPI000D077175|nr:AAA family ATPase [Pleurocapsa sp. CCALA 161]PSB11711.1 ATP-binding protein [Pleurocapsa sp. CCALA 161]